MITMPSVYTAPKFSLSARRIAEISFIGTVPLAPAQLTLLSSLISFSFVVRSVNIDFGHDHTDSVLHYILLSHNRTASTTSCPADTNALTGLSELAYVIGNNREKRYFPNTEWRDPPSYVKVHIDNNNAYAVTVKVTVTIEELV